MSQLQIICLVEDYVILQINCHIRNFMCPLALFPNSYLPNMVWILLIVILKQICVICLSVTSTFANGNSPTSISNIPSSFINYFSISNFVGELSVMSMMFKSSNIVSLIKQRCPILCAFLDDVHIILR